MKLKASNSSQGFFMANSLHLFDFKGTFGKIPFFIANFMLYTHLQKKSRQ